MICDTTYVLEIKQGFNWKEKCWLEETNTVQCLNKHSINCEKENFIRFNVVKKSC